ncbi:hypothetical protein D3H65_15780 [Paraflavitalea soli]|uniref:Uncharacterized protein n=1 Tax=Paraflavitalea soli TaxID=2315862 RepID=A0A3B7MVR7_9BACT|nr:hypothetical protein D3H65_15780 [Paraflavitalea soli]
MSVSLLVSLFIYVFYRTEKTLVNQVIMALISREHYYAIKCGVTTALLLQDYLVYSLPEGLWVFCITITSSFFYLKVRNRQWSLVFVPIGMALILEILQLLHITNGRFDWMDIVFSAGFWLLALLLTSTNRGKEPLFQSFNVKTCCCVASYCIVYLAHVSW